MLNHVLLPLDGSKLAEQAIYPIKHVLRPDGQITLLHVAANEAEAQTATDYLEGVAMRLKLDGYQVHIEVLDGDPPEVIVERAVKLGVDLIAMCTHGRSGLQKLIYGSVTGEVLNNTLCPVLVIPNRVRQEKPQDAPTVTPDPSPGLAG
ncbi:MAG TPA: universal stress protein [Phototrophicaceae bacterium]|nr:universal stress protein [Phototrophicaceae bacterium]